MSEYVCIKHESAACNKCVEEMRVLESERDALRAEVDRDRIEIENLRRWRTLAAGAREVLDDYGQHCPECVLAQYSHGQPTSDGGYRTMYAGKWYQNCPIDETPKCQCGFDEALRSYEAGKEKP